LLQNGANLRYALRILIADLPSVRNAAQVSENARKNSFLNYKSTAPVLLAASPAAGSTWPTPPAPATTDVSSASLNGVDAKGKDQQLELRTAAPRRLQSLHPEKNQKSSQ
jgi:hypothetical protein